MHLEELHPKMQKHIMEGIIAVTLWAFCLMLYVVMVDFAYGALKSHPDNHILWVFTLGSTVVITNVFIVLTRITFRATVLMVKTSRKAIQVLNNK